MRFAMRALAFGGGYPALIVVAALMDFRRAFAFALARQAENGTSLFEGLDYLLLAEWVCIVAAARKADWGAVDASRLERALGLALAAYGLFGVCGCSHWMTMAACGLIATKLASRPGARWLGAAIAIVGGQYVFGWPLFASWRAPFAQIDARAVHQLLAIAGQASDYSDSSVRLRGSAFAIRILAGCATSSVVSAVAAAFLIFSLCWRAPLAAVARGLAAAVGACWIVNVLRLALMAQSEDDYRYWHDGGGTAIVSLAMAVVAYLTAAAVARVNAPAPPVWPNERSPS
jgi:exosortase/archaeosortase family protein